MLINKNCHYVFTISFLIFQLEQLTIKFVFNIFNFLISLQIKNKSIFYTLPINNII